MKIGKKIFFKKKLFVKPNWCLRVAIRGSRSHLAKLMDFMATVAILSHFKGVFGVKWPFF